MTRRTFVHTTAATPTLGLLPGFLKSKKKPNIIYILADDLGYNELGCCGQTKIKTPNIDKLCAGGMKFTQHYSGNPVCAPSRCSLMTRRRWSSACRAGRTGRPNPFEAGRS